MDNEICGMVLRMLKGIEPKDDFPSLSLFEELLSESHLLISDHTRKHIKNELNKVMTRESKKYGLNKLPID